MVRLRSRAYAAICFLSFYCVYLYCVYAHVLWTPSQLENTVIIGLLTFSKYRQCDNEHVQLNLKWRCHIFCRMHLMLPLVKNVLGVFNLPVWLIRFIQRAAVACEKRKYSCWYCSISHHIFWGLPGLSFFLCGCVAMHMAEFTWSSGVVDRQTVMWRNAHVDQRTVWGNANRLVRMYAFLCRGLGFLRCGVAGCCCFCVSLYGSGWGIMTNREANGNDILVKPSKWIHISNSDRRVSFFWCIFLRRDRLTQANRSCPE